MVFPPNLSASTKNLIAIAAKVDSVTILRGLKWWERIPHATCYPCFQTFQAFWWCGHCLVFSSVRIYILSKKRKIGYLIQNPKSKIQNPKSKIQNPKSKRYLRPAKPPGPCQPSTAPAPPPRPRAACSARSAQSDWRLVWCAWCSACIFFASFAFSAAFRESTNAFKSCANFIFLCTSSRRYFKYCSSYMFKTTSGRSFS